MTFFVLFPKNSEVHKGIMWMCSTGGITVDLRVKRPGDGTEAHNTHKILYNIAPGV